MKSFYDFVDFIYDDMLYEEVSKTQKANHLPHLEDLLHLNGNKSMEFIGNVLDDLHTSLCGKAKATFNSPTAKTKVAEKFDGHPTLTFGRYPNERKFFVATDDGEGNLIHNFSHEDIENNYLHSPDMMNRVKHAFEHLPKIAPKKGVYQGDMLYHEGSAEYKEGSYHFTPNTITYKVKRQSPTGQLIKNAKLGLVLHSKIDKNTPTPAVDYENFNEHPDVHVVNPFMNFDPLLYTTGDRKEFTSHLENTKIKYTKMSPETLENVAEHKDHIHKFLNSTIKGSTKPDTDGYIWWLGAQANKEAEHSKTPSKVEAIRRKYHTLIQDVQQKEKDFTSAFDLYGHVQKAKNELLRVFRKNRPDFEYYIDNKKIDPEGYIAYREGEDPVKLVNKQNLTKLIKSSKNANRRKEKTKKV